MASQPVQVSDPELGHLLQQKGLTQAGDVMQLGAVDLCELLGIGAERCAQLLSEVAAQIAPKATTALHLLQVCAPFPPHTRSPLSASIQDLAGALEAYRGA